MKMASSLAGATTLDKSINPHIVYVTDDKSGKAIYYAAQTGDRDGDGLTDQDEAYIHHTDPDNSDSDNDGLSDGAEMNQYHTDPNISDSDGDGMSDREEVITGSQPTNSASIWGVTMPTYDGTWHTNVVWDDGAWVTQTWLHAERCILGWQTLTGRTYRLYGTTNLSEPWVANSPPIAGTGSNISFSTDNIDPLNWFFRLGVELTP